MTGIVDASLSFTQDAGDSELTGSYAALKQPYDPVGFCWRRGIYFELINPASETMHLRRRDSAFESQGDEE